MLYITPNLGQYQSLSFLPFYSSIRAISLGPLPLNPRTGTSEKRRQKPISGPDCLSDSEFQARRFLPSIAADPKGRDGRALCLLVTYLLAQKKSDSPRRAKQGVSDTRLRTSGYTIE
ncbi:MAG: hypothetical protein JAY88_12995 [Candidatus Thiodiazotropha lotti]|nr:hypothetical protein [Candidatus Thiodiazotropha lotti]